MSRHVQGADLISDLWSVPSVSQAGVYSGVHHDRMWYWDCIDTTLSHASHVSALCGDNERLWIRAGRQTNGQGQRGKSFTALHGGLYMTLVMLWPAHQACHLLSLVAALAVVDVMPIDVRIKWINDVYYGREKIAGVLTHVVHHTNDTVEVWISIGMNVNTDVQCLHSAGVQATSLAAVCGHSFDIESLFQRIRTSLDMRLQQYCFSAPDLWSDLYSCLWGWGQSVCVTTDRQDQYTGCWTGIDSTTGQVILDGQHYYDAQRIWPTTLDA